jgi:hypothetical protein
LNVVTVTNEAYNPAGLNITAGGALTLEATATPTVKPRRRQRRKANEDDPTATVGVGAAVAINVVNTDTKLISRTERRRRSSFVHQRGHDGAG